MQKHYIKINKRTAAMLEGNIEKSLFNAFLALAGLSFFLYVFFTGLTTFNIVDRDNLGKENALLRSAVSELELDYLSEAQKINLNLAYSLGFKDAQRAVFATGASEPLSLAEN